MPLFCMSHVRAYDLHHLGVVEREQRFTDVASAVEETANLDEESPATHFESEASDSSRGGTRTRDPGIMSAVL